MLRPELIKLHLKILNACVFLPFESLVSCYVPVVVQTGIQNTDLEFSTILECS